MSLRNIRKIGDELLRKKSRKIEIIDDRIIDLLDDLKDTMYKSEGVGLAAPQVGVLRRAVVVDVGAGYFEFINPVITKSEGEDVKTEACLSVPDKVGDVTRPTKITVTALDRNGNEFTLEAEDYFARAICHELDHLDGVLFLDKATNIGPRE